MERCPPVVLPHDFERVSVLDDHLAETIRRGLDPFWNRLERLNLGKCLTPDERKS